MVYLLSRWACPIPIAGFASILEQDKKELGSI
jgi:hypothetical protein